MNCQQDYDKKFKEIQDLMQELNRKLENHKNNRRENNWSYNGDLGYIKSQLEVITQFVR